MLRALTSAYAPRILFPLAVLLGYSLLPLGLTLAGFTHSHFLKLATLAAIAAVALWIGALLPFPLHRFGKVSIRPELFLLAVWIAFFSFIALAWVTAEKIPVIASFQGADANTIAILRERFLKARVGWQASFVYINAIFVGFLIPYCIALMFLCRFKLRWICFGVFLVYTLSFAEKGMFFKAVVPLFYLVVQRQVRSLVRPSMLVAAILGLLALVTAVSRLGEGYETNDVGFFSARYVPSTPIDYMVWRAVAIPLITAADALVVFQEHFAGQPLHGATSSLLTRLSSVEIVPFERFVFAEQWGQNETGTGSANSVYLTEAYVNFGVAGVVLFSLFIGAVLRLFSISRDHAFQSVWLLLCLNLYYAGLIGTLLSNGFLLLMSTAILVRFKTPSRGGSVPRLPVPSSL